MRPFSLFAAYCNSRKGVLGLCLLQTALLLVICRLYGMTMAPILYAVIVQWAVLAIAAALDYRNYYKQVQLLKSLKKQAEGYIGQMPKTADLQRKMQYGIMEQLDEKYRHMQQRYSADALMARKYYTLWSHQIKTPISAMRLLLQEEHLNPRALEQELFKTEQYAQMALQYQRLNTPTKDLLLKKYPLGAIVKKAVKETSTLFIGKKIKIHMGEINTTVLTDEKWLIFVLEQLLTNAVKYTPEGGSVRIYAQKHLLLIEDNGMGINSSDLPRVFEWGFTGDNGHETTRATGIGLCLCKQVMDLLGHTISITSQVGKGTVVKLDLSREQFDIE